MANHFINKRNLALLSRGYGRKTKGYILADSMSSANEIGDEPMQYFTKFGDNAGVAVGEKRVDAIVKMLAHTKYDLFLLDDAYQHRSLKASLYVLLTDYARLFTDDFVLPLGLLRESREGASRADVIVVSKCPSDLSLKEREKIIRKINIYSEAQVFFSEMVKGDAVNYLSKEKLNKNSKVVTLSAIAQNDLFINQVSHDFEIQKSFCFSDHHQFTLGELKQIVDYLGDRSFSVVTTEKDYMRLSQPEFMEFTSKMSIFVVPIKVHFLAKEREFLSLIEQEVFSSRNRVLKLKK